MGDRSYKDDEARAIIDRALKAESGTRVSHEDLLAIGRGVGLSPAAIESAAQDLAETRLSDAATAEVVSRRRRGFAVHALVFLVVNGFLFTINALTTPGQWWAFFPLSAWGLALALHAVLGLSARVSPRRLRRERRRVQQRLAEQQPRLRVGEVLDDSADFDALAARDPHAEKREH
jgi:hypothetical protein